MLKRLKEARLLVPAVMTLAGLAVLLALGTWQLQRRAWKNDLVGKIAARAQAEPVSLSRALELSRWQDIEYLRVHVKGQLEGTESHHYAPNRSGPGYHVYSPLRTDDGLLVLVNRGFVPEALKDPGLRARGQSAGDTELTGLVRMPRERGWFVPPTDLVRNRFFWPDYPNMLGTARAAGKGQWNPVPFFIDVEAKPANPGGWPKGGVTNLDIPNRHLEYAISWYGLALTLAGVFGAFAWGRRQAGVA